MGKTRSPNYPQLDFAEALEKARIIYKSAHQHIISDEEIAEALEYKSLNGRSMGVISAIKKYGLLVPEGEGFKISEDAFNVFELPPESKEHFESLKKMAFIPQVFVEIRETYGDNLPSDQILRHYLIKNKFNPNVADEVIKNFHATIELVTQAEARYNQFMESNAPQPAQVLVPTARHSAIGTQPYRYSAVSFDDDFKNPKEDIDSGQELKFRISADSEARIIFKGEVTQKAIKKLIGLLNLSLDTFPAGDVVTATEQQQITVQPSLLPESNSEDVAEDEEETISE